MGMYFLLHLASFCHSERSEESDCCHEMKKTLEFFISWRCFAQIPEISGHEMEEHGCFFISWQRNRLYSGSVTAIL